jgi:hypothetical protein
VIYLYLDALSAWITARQHSATLSVEETGKTGVAPQAAE